METPQGQPQNQEPNAQQGQPVAEPAGVSPEELQKYGVQEPAPAPAAAPQGQPEGQQTQTSLDDSSRHFQSLYNQTYAEKLALQQQIQAMQMQMLQNQVAPAQNHTQAAPDPNVDPVGYLDWKVSQQINSLRNELPKALQEQNQQWIQGLYAQAQESQFAQTHPDVNINELKAYAQSRGISRLEDAYALLTLPKTVTSIAQSTAQQVTQSMAKPNAGAVPVRPGASSSAPPALDYGKLYQEYVSTNGNPNWSTGLKSWFFEQTARMGG